MREAQLLDRRNPAVEYLSHARPQRLVLVAVESSREHGREQEQPEHDARVTRCERPASVHDLLRPAGNRPFRERREREADTRRRLEAAARSSRPSLREA